MKIAIISYDADFLSKLQDLIKDADYRNYIDSISLLNEFHLFTPDAVIYDASSGIFAEEDLKFLSEKEEFKTIPLFVGISKENPINTEGFPQNFKFFTKEDDNELREIINEILNMKIEEKETPIENIEEYLITESYNLDLEPQGEKESLSNFEDIEDLLMESIIEENTVVESNQTKVEGNIIQPKKEETIEIRQETKPKTYFISISLTEEDIKAIIKEQISEFIKNDETMIKILDHLQIDFTNEMNNELNALKIEIKESLKEKYKNSLEDEIQNIIKAELKKDIKELAEKLAKEKLEQVFSKLF